ncbi:glycosyltransferase [Paenibacillus thermotolerans]|uniref:glycosyltransferase n=1 Tax=Paenibacillus thermotolerans TaxID=3027807 RepID=UPI00236831D8|nr:MULTISPECIES: glycosyltransferase [unclassified Paenibacillus]
MKRISHKIKNSPKPSLSVIISADDESSAITQVINEAKKITNRTEIIVVCLGSNETTAKYAEKAGARVIRMKDAMSSNAGRAIGAAIAEGEIILFTDTCVIPANVLRKYYQDVLEGWDVVLNGYSGIDPTRPINEAKRFLNKLVDHSELRASSLSAVPHALSRNALKKIGYTNLAVPPKAFVKAVLNGLTVKRGYRLDVHKWRKTRNAMDTSLILGDHAEAISNIITVRGERGGFTDFLRQRELLKNHVLKVSTETDAPKKDIPIEMKTKDLPTDTWKRKTLSVIISASNEEDTIQDVIKNVKELMPKEIIVVENGSKDRTKEICLSLGVKCISYENSIGHDIGRAIGAMESTGDILLFLDGDIVFSPEQLIPFIKSCCENVDIALNNVNPFYLHKSMIDAVSLAKSFLNRLLSFPQLGYSSLTAIPHAMKRDAAEFIGFENLAVPPKAHAIALLFGLQVDQVQGINVLISNKIRPVHLTESNKVEQMILGDHIEAIHWVQSLIGRRVFYQEHDDALEKYVANPPKTLNSASFPNRIERKVTSLAKRKKI